MGTPSDTLASQAFIRESIDRLRRKLLDLTARNPLLAFKHTTRGRRFVRVVDELPNHLHGRLAADKSLRLKGLPQPTSEPADERTIQFRRALEQAKIEDEIYLARLEELGEAANERELQMAEIELRGRVRENLGMPPAMRSPTLTPAAVAKSKGIDPSFDLPAPDAQLPAAKHEDDVIQTLLFDDQLHRTLNGIRDHTRSSLDETGVNILYCAFGFLEWFEDENSATSLYAPLLLYPIAISQQLVRGQYQYAIASLGDDLATNATLRERLRRDFGIELPEIEDEEKPEAYFARVQRVIEVRKNWRVRRWVTIGLFNFTRLAMYNDLDPNVWPKSRSLTEHSGVAKILAGCGAEPSAISYAGDEDLDAASTDYSGERTELLTIHDADSSQISAVLDVMVGKDLVIEGPPGTGKSQTITNIIASAMSRRKTVLFVAEKMAALNVVHSRMREAGLGEFCLAIHSTRASRNEVVKALRDRVNFRRPLHREMDVDAAIRELRQLRTQLRGYVAALNQPAGLIGGSIHDVFWRLQRLRDEHPDLPHDLDQITLDGAESISAVDAQRARQSLEMLAKHRQAILDQYQSLRRHPWYGVAHPTLDAFSASDVVHLVRTIAEGARKCASADCKVAQLTGIDETRSMQQMHELAIVLLKVSPPSPNLDGSLAARLLTREARVVVTQFVEAVKRYRNLSSTLSQQFNAPTNLQDADPVIFRQIEELAGRHALEDLRVAQIGTTATVADRDLQKLEHATRTASVIAQLFNFKDVPSVGDMDRLLAACGVAGEAPSALISGRDPCLLDHKAYEVVKSAIATYKRLVDARKRLESVFNLSDTLDPLALQSNAAALRNAPVVPWFSLAWWRARQAYRRLARTPEKLRTSDVVARLEALASYCHELRKFNADAGIKQLLGERFQGLETDFKSIAAIVEWARIVRKHFHSGDKLGHTIRKALFESSSETFEAFRAQVADEGFGILDELCNAGPADARLSDMVDRLRQRADAIKTLADLTSRCMLHPQVMLRDCGKMAADVQAFHDLRAYLNGPNDAQPLLANHYDGVHTDLERLIVSAQYSQQLEDAGVTQGLRNWLLAADQSNRLHSLKEAASQLHDSVQAVQKHRDALYAITPIDTKAWLGFDDLLETEPLEVSARLERIAELPEELETLVDDQRAQEMAIDCGLESILKLFEHAKYPLRMLPHAYDRVLYQSIARAAVSRSPDLQRFAGMTYEGARERFRKLDRQLMDLQRRQLACELLQRPVDQGTSVGSRKSWTGMRLVELETSKQKQHPSIRDLMDRAGRSVQQLMPCFMMSPLTIAQYLKTDGMRFDLVVMDEASQLRPEDAVGAVARGGQIVIVGDPKQLPPTDFFRRSDSDDDDDDQGGTVADEESILDAALAVVRPARRLKWHYRSRHESLIAYSNREFYDGDLVVFPSPYSDHNDLGVRMVHVADGCLKSRVNMKEVERVAQDALEFMQLRPNHSLGIVAMNQPQRDAISLRLDELFETHPAAEAYRVKWEGTLEPFFIKNLENVQGDERDVIFISTVYGRDAEGNFFQRFGPINSDGGHRRLNVLFTRAKRQVVLFTSMDSGMIRVDGASKWGVRVLKGYLDYARNGRLTQPVPDTGRSPESDFEVSVARRLREAGFEVVPQVGVAGFFIDLAVRHPGQPGTFALGIECDGAMYHSAKSARDRDRLRQEVLENLGWRIHRIWSLDWYRNNARETQRLISRVRDACEASSTMC